MPGIRRATHCGSWYTDDVQKLNQQLDQWLNAVTVVHNPAKAIISPHAGYEYCGSCAAFSYKQIDPQQIDRVFVLGPAHHVRLSRCALTDCDYYETPFYNLRIDKQVNEELLATGAFERMSRRTDEDEHSIEMQLPLLAKTMQPRGENNFTVVPVLVGSLSGAAERDYGRVLARYLSQPRTLFVISSDFCHWGERFSYTHYEQSWGNEIWKSIERLDRLGIEAIETHSHATFLDYLGKYHNTICGRHPIGVLLAAMNELTGGIGTNGTPNPDGVTGLKIRFLNYKQSSRCTRADDSSVSYAAGVLAPLSAAAAASASSSQ